MTTPEHSATHSKHPTSPGEPPTPAEDPLLDRMIRRPTEADFEDILNSEGESGDIAPRDVTDATLPFPSNGSLGGTVSTPAGS